MGKEDLCHRQQKREIKRQKFVHILQSDLEETRSFARSDGTD